LQVFRCFLGFGALVCYAISPQLGTNGGKTSTESQLAIEITIVAINMFVAIIGHWLFTKMEMQPYPLDAFGKTPSSRQSNIHSGGGSSHYANENDDESALLDQNIAGGSSSTVVVANKTVFVSGCPGFIVDSAGGGNASSGFEASEAAQSVGETDFWDLLCIVIEGSVWLFCVKYSAIAALSTLRQKSLCASDATEVTHNEHVEGTKPCPPLPAHRLATTLKTLFGTLAPPWMVAWCGSKRMLPPLPRRLSQQSPPFAETTLHQSGRKTPLWCRRWLCRSCSQVSVTKLGTV
jgi:hypothetical protein